MACPPPPSRAHTRVAFRLPSVRRLTFQTRSSSWRRVALVFTPWILLAQEASSSLSPWLA